MKVAFVMFEYLLFIIGGLEVCASHVAEEFVIDKESGSWRMSI